MNLNNLQVPVKKEIVEEDENGLKKVRVGTELEAFNPDGEQSDGSRWFVPQPMVEGGHEHSFELKNPSDRFVQCRCGLGGAFYPHNAKLIKGHVYNLKNQKII